MNLLLQQQRQGAQEDFQTAAVCCVIGGGYAWRIEDAIRRHKIMFEVAREFWHRRGLREAYRHPTSAAPFCSLSVLPLDPKKYPARTGTSATTRSERNTNSSRSPQCASPRLHANPLLVAAAAPVSSASAASGHEALPSHLREYYQRNLHLKEESHPVAIAHRRVLEYLVGGPLKGPFRSHRGSEGGASGKEEFGSKNLEGYSQEVHTDTALKQQHQTELNDDPCCVRPDAVYTDLRGSPVALWHSLSPLLSPAVNFGLLNIPEDHPARSSKQTFYTTGVSSTGGPNEGRRLCLRTHTSAHIPACLQWALRQWGPPKRGFQGPPAKEALREGGLQGVGAPGGPLTLVISGEVYRRDAIDCWHFPVFHQMDVLRVLPPGADALQDLKQVVGELLGFLLPGRQYRLLKDFFPFTDPSIEAEVLGDDSRYLEILGGGILLPSIVSAAMPLPFRYKSVSAAQQVSQLPVVWALGLGLDRVCMCGCAIGDIRLLVESHPLLLQQFSDGILKKVRPFSRLQPSSVLRQGSRGIGGTFRQGR
ncbi:uncharacterized protein LOC34623878 [Cyclospora cayetanensis]|uniref:phenylalanine--tRNA ligase n=1 Tax=Cyclospora cayetanensis TaxID=88456 RepID=A0A6P6RRK0_9EIME|nr:uncharacterized protein LOC34623878 [Cyclospora cayetanensis]